MPKITVSKSLYEKLENAADEDVEEVLWKMMYLFQRSNDPSE